jgi:hypothetical protein
LWLARAGDEVRLSEPARFAGFYARVVECNGIEALVAFPDKSQTLVPVESLTLVLRPAPAEAPRSIEQRLRAEELAGEHARSCRYGRDDP